ncbi:MAG TPA: S41 family peptidase [Chloroflexia bacterium]|jgi:hypothetical protein
MVETPVFLDADTRREVIENLARSVESDYVFPEVAQTMSEKLRMALAAGTYDDIVEPVALRERLTTDLQDVCHDKHVRVRCGGEIHFFGSPDEDADAARAEELAAAQWDNFGFYRVERLAGNIGYLDLHIFWDAGLPGAGDAAVAAMNLLAYTDALIIDLRKNGGGSPSMVGLLSSFLFGPEPVHLNSFYDRRDAKTRQFWTSAYVPGPRTPDKPVFVLTSTTTFSGAEEFTYNLKNLKRATIIGETTGGGAHPGGYVDLTSGFCVFLPGGRAVNPITGTNWEGKGVEPDIEVPQAEAFDLAYRLALETVLAKLEDAPTRSAQARGKEVRAALAAYQSGSETDVRQDG